jgi:16S rRNA C967 or C1407 C5-methylase (RsmB/RsmF family)/NOL1/NOP2/fmu family ribosome biogenesis protein
MHWISTLNHFMNKVFPPLFEVKMRELLSTDWEAFLASHQLSPPVSIRINPKKSNAIDSAPIPWTQYGYYLASRPSFTLDPSFHAGAYYVQDASSLFLEQAVKQSLDLSQPLRVLDLCAAPGGKSTHLLSLISADSLLIANEVIGSRATILSENIQKWGHANVVVTNNDPGDFQRLPGYFDAIVVDAPCSGEGLFRKDPQAMNEWSPEAVKLCSQRQRRILHDIWPSLKQSGILIYCTCTYNEKENEDNLIWLQQQKGLESVELKINPSWGIQKIEKGNITGYRFFPHALQGEGFFMAVLTKTGDETAIRMKPKTSFTSPAKKMADSLREWLQDSSSFSFILHGELILMIPSDYQTDITWLSEKLKVVNKGTAMATQKHDKLVPEHALALSNQVNKHTLSKIELTKEQALAYLRKENLPVLEEKRGFALAVYEGLPLGWVNLLGTRINNLYPSAWRIRHL